LANITAKLRPETSICSWSKETVAEGGRTGQDFIRLSSGTYQGQAVRSALQNHVTGFFS